jgi:hypothetical protein
MSVIDDLATAVANYATNDCDTTITGYSVTTGTSTGANATLNSGDEFQYKVQVVNNGEFDMKNVRIRVNGSNWADVALSGSTGVFGSTALLDPTPPINIDAHQSFTTGFFRGKAKAGADTNGVNKDIVTAQIDGWNGVWDHVLNDRSGSGAIEGKLSKTVVPG